MGEDDPGETVETVSWETGGQYPRGAGYWGHYLRCDGCIRLPPILRGGGVQHQYVGGEALGVASVSQWRVWNVAVVAEGLDEVLFKPESIVERQGMFVKNLNGVVSILLAPAMTGACLDGDADLVARIIHERSGLCDFPAAVQL
jgi:hypothetical protein